MSWKKSIDWWVILVIVLVMGWRASSQLAGMAGVEQDILAPTITLESVEGERWALGELKGRVVLVSFWATWCRECEPEMRALQSLQSQYGTGDLVVLALSVGSESDAAIRSFGLEHGIEFWLGRGTMPVRVAFGGVPGVPTTFVIDRSGLIRHRFYGPLSALALRSAVDRLIERTS